MKKIIYQPKAIKQLRKLPNQEILRKKIAALANMPDCINVKKLSNHLYDYRLRVGNYRVLFNYDGNISNIVSIEEVKKRDDRTY